MQEARREEDLTAVASRISSLETTIGCTSNNLNMTVAHLPV